MASSDAPRGDGARTALAVAAAYLTFLLFAQFGFLRQLERDLASTTAIRVVMAWMAAGGLLASAGTAVALGRVAPAPLVRLGLAGSAVAALASLACHAMWSLCAVAALVGVAIACTTVALASGLRGFTGDRHPALIAGAGTGLAYAIANVPPLFEAEPWLRAVVPAASCLAAAAWAPRDGARTAAPDRDDAPALWRVLPAFLLLVWLDSAAFTFIQQTAALKARSWSAGSGEALQGLSHLVAALAAGALLDRGRIAIVLAATWVAFAGGLPLIAHGVHAGGPLYAIGISLYSVALVTFPSSAGSDVARARWRAAMLYGVAGWIGSALGVGMAQDLGRLPYTLIVAAGAAVLFATPPSRRALRTFARTYGGALAIGVVGSMLVSRGAIRVPAAGDPAARGREVYIAEGCIHCHSQYVRAGTLDETWWGPFRPLDRDQTPPLIGARRQGPDLLNVGRRRSTRWEELHLRDPRALTPASRMPRYAHLFADGDPRGPALVAYLDARRAEAPDVAVSAAALIGPASTAGVARGERLFGELCASCHGLRGNGDGPLATALADPLVDLRHHPPSGRELSRVVRDGIAGTSMPGHESLAPDDVAALVAYTRSLIAR